MPPRRTRRKLRRMGRRSVSGYVSSPTPEIALRLTAVLLLLPSCIQEVNQVAGTGAVYHTRCSSEMTIREGEYFASCAPESCRETFVSGGVSHVVVGLEPGKRIVGYAEQVCIQDLADATAMFQGAAVLQATEEAPQTEEPDREELDANPESR